MSGVTTFSQATADEICSRLAEGESLRAICGSPDMPDKATVFRWLGSDQAFRDQYALAREAQADALFDEMIDIADDATNDWMERKGDNGSGYELNGEHIQRSKLRIEARKWMASKLQPKKYGDKVSAELTGKDGGAIQMRWVAGDEPAPDA